MGYRLKEQTITVRLDGDYAGAEITGLKSLTWGALSEIVLLTQQVKTDDKIATEADKQVDRARQAELLPKIEAWLKDWLRAWNLEDPQGNAIVLGDFRALDSGLVFAMFNAMSGALSSGNALPPASGATSTQASSAG